LKTKGRHLLVEYRGCDAGLLNDRTLIENVMRQAVVVAGATEVGSIFRNFTPQGVSGVVVVEESHLSIHTWPEYRYAAVDFYTCGECLPEAAHRYLGERLGCESSEVMVVERGLEPPGRSLRVACHDPERDDSALAEPVC
jgi:S-adenosylmethionine decarboxylase proenzyme